MRRYQDITTTNTATSNWLPVDNNIIDFQIGLHVVVSSGTPTYTVQGTLDDIQDPAVTPVAFSIPVAALVAATATQIGTLTMPVKAIRLTQTGTGVTIMKTLQQGII